MGGLREDLARIRENRVYSAKRRVAIFPPREKAMSRFSRCDFVKGSVWAGTPTVGFFKLSTMKTASPFAGRRTARQPKSRLHGCWPGSPGLFPSPARRTSRTLVKTWELSGSRSAPPNSMASIRRFPALPYTARLLSGLMELSEVEAPLKMPIKPVCAEERRQEPSKAALRNPGSGFPNLLLLIYWKYYEKI